MGYEDQTHAELGELLKQRGMEVPRTKNERIAALEEAMQVLHSCLELNPLYHLGHLYP